MRCWRWLLFFGIALAQAPGAQAQDAEALSSCEETLRLAEDEFRAGRFFGVPSILADCMPRFSREQRLRAFLLLTQTHLLLDEPQAAENNFLNVLRTDPEFVPDPQTDPTDIVNLSKKFTSTAVFTPHAKMGTNLTMPRTGQTTDLFGMPVLQNEQVMPGLNLGVGVEWNITPRWGLGAEVFFSGRSYGRVRSGFFEQDVSSMTARQLWIDLPLYVRYQDVVGKWRPFGYAGYAFNILLSARSAYEKTDFTAAGGGEGTAPFQVSNSSAFVNVTSRYQTINRSLVLGGGVKYKIGRDFLIADIRYMMGLNIVPQRERLFYQNGDGYRFDPAISGYAFVNDLFRLDNVMLTVGYVRPLYKPRKLRSGTRFFKRKKE